MLKSRPMYFDGDDTWMTDTGMWHREDGPAHYSTRLRDADESGKWYFYGIKKTKEVLEWFKTYNADPKKPIPEHLKVIWKLTFLGR